MNLPSRKEPECHPVVFMSELFQMFTVIEHLNDLTLQILVLSVDPAYSRKNRTPSVEMFLIIIWNLQIPTNGFHSTVFGWYPDYHLDLTVALHQLGHTPAGN